MFCLKRECMDGLERTPLGAQSEAGRPYGLVVPFPETRTFVCLKTSFYLCGMESTPTIRTSTDVIRDFNSSIIAKSETNDCVVKAIAVIYGCTYDMAHETAKHDMDRKDREGVQMMTLINWIMKVQWCERVLTEQPKISFLPSPKTVKIIKKTGKKIFHKMTVGTFIKQYPTGRYFVIVKGHIFAVVDGEILGNPNDAIKLKTIVHHAFKATSNDLS